MREDKKKKVMSALVTEPTRKKACEVAGISERTLYNYMNDPDFMYEYQGILNGVVADTTLRMKEAAHKATEHIISVIEDEDVDVQTRLKADKLALEMVIRVAEHERDLKKDAFDFIAELLCARAEELAEEELENERIS